ncbi:WD-40 repeat-containing protein [Wolfiporia cocos MD-104 SS10]|uniref:ASTRA-associated protein 1 n=1 Tax=Wolfiporia cocos (strain MD-104) TaxID=742152 RepID=A0A2H3K0C5_WOLCO|nr:WD-40 repeat-containing protein [Wolfiporia cocos MD-104 SS10]
MSSSKPPPPTPAHILRTHTAQVNVLQFSRDNERLYSGDAEGVVAVTSTRTLRPSAVWNAHTDGILGVEEWEECIITHGRDDKLHVWQRVQEPGASLGHSAAVPGLQTPKLLYSMDVNALNYCRFSLLPLLDDEGGDERRALIALPNLVESSLADVWTLPGRQRLHAAIGKASHPETSTDGRGINTTGIIMSLHLFQVPHPEVSGRSQLRMLCAYENGGVTAYAYKRTDKETSVEGIGWETLWNVKLHVETVMAMAVSRDNKLALTVSADHLIGRYDIQAAENAENSQAVCTVHRTKHPGNASITIRDDGRVCAVGGWDGKIRLYSTKTLKTLGTLDYHKKSCQTLAFARSDPSVSNEMTGTIDDVGDSDDDFGEEERRERSRWLAAGGQDNRVSIWPLISFDNTTKS